VANSPTTGSVPRSLKGFTLVCLVMVVVTAGLIVASQLLDNWWMGLAVLALWSCGITAALVLIAAVNWIRFAVSGKHPTRT
jgi:hypothetical protein